MNGVFIFTELFSTYSQVSNGQWDNKIVWENLERIVNKDTEDDENVTNNGDDDDACQQQDGQDGFPEIK